MARKKKTPYHKRFCKDLGGLFLQAGKEYSSIAAYAGREITGQSHDPKRRKCTLKKGWFE